MLLVIIFAARRVVHCHSLPATFSARLGAAFIPLGFLLATEFTIVLEFRLLTLAEYFAGRDPLAGTVYLAMLLVLSKMPFLIARK